MVTPGFHKDSFKSTGGLEFTTAWYVLLGSGQLGMAVASATFAPLSDKYGRKNIFIFNLFCATVGAIFKWLMRGTFWGFVGANFVANFFGGGINAIAMAYIGDVFATEPAKKDETIGMVIFFFLLGGGLGGILAILMENEGLFDALFLGAGLEAVATFACLYNMVEPEKELHEAVFSDFENETPASDDIESENKPTGSQGAGDGPKELDTKLLANVLIGAIADNIGSAGMMMAITPVAVNLYTFDFLLAGKEPPLTMDGYKWLSCLFILAVIPGIAVGVAVNGTKGNGFGVVFGNLATAFFIAILTLVAFYPDADSGMFALFLVIFFFGYPFTVCSQLTTGPMLDAIAPPERRGEIQG